MGREVPAESPPLSSLLSLDLSGQVNLLLADALIWWRGFSFNKHNGRAEIMMYQLVCPVVWFANTEVISKCLYRVRIEEGIRTKSSGKVP